MAYKRFGFILIAVNVLLLLILIFAGLRHEKNISAHNSISAETVSGGKLPRLSDLEEASAMAIEKTDTGNTDDTKKIRDTGFLLLLSSVNGDLKIRIVDNKGSAAAGHNWKAVIYGISSSTGASDTDNDGVIYVPSIPGGRYMVEVEGAGEAGITVKNNVKYTAVTDIRKILLPESSINAAVEDTGINDETDDGSVSSGNIDPAGGGTGIDVSKYNKDIDWAAVAASGIQYAVIRAGYRGSSTGCLVEDPCFEKNFAGAKAAGLKTGIYFFTQAVNTDEASEEALAVASMVNAADLELPVYLDVEGSGRAGGRADGLDIDTRTENIKTFCDTMKSLGFNAGVYANKKWLTTSIDTSKLSDYPIWLAQYNVEKPTYEGRYSMWQYSSKGHVNGIEGNVDMDLAIQNQEQEK